MREVELVEPWWDELRHPITGLTTPADERHDRSTPAQKLASGKKADCLPFTHPDYKEPVTDINRMEIRALEAALQSEEYE